MIWSLNLKMNRGKLTAIKFREKIGIEDPNEISLEDVITGIGGYVNYKPMGQVDARIIYGKRISTIYINSEIEYEGRKRFALAHELGHLLMHKGSKTHDDGLSLSWFNEMETKLKKGVQEYEANQFASEYLMPSALFLKEAEGIRLSPSLLKSLSKRFHTSITSAAFKYFDTDLYPMAMFHIFNGEVKYWKKSSDLKVYIKELTKLAPPSDSLASEYIEADYESIYKSHELMQQINKSTWFELFESEDDSEYIEYCIVTRSFKNILSLVWQL